MKIIKGALVVLVVVLLTLSACGVENNGKSSTISIEKAQPKITTGSLSDYFPIDTGREWTYKITIGQTEPIYYYETNWPMGETGVSYATIGRFMPLVDENPPKNFLLKIKVKGPATEQGPVHYPIGVELTIEEDSLGIFDYPEEVFWAITTAKGFMVNQVVTYSPFSGLGPMTGPFGGSGGWAGENGFSMRVLFFEAEPGTSVGVYESPDRIYFKGPDINLPGYPGKLCLHFQRKVALSKENKDESDSIGRDFTEDTWFAKGIGLVRLEQRVEGTISMIWTLQSSAKSGDITL